MPYTTANSMREFADLYNCLDAAKSSSSKVILLKKYLEAASPEDAAWTVALLVKQTPARTVLARDLRAWSASDVGIPAWLFERCYAASGDLSETSALLASSLKASAGDASAEALSRLPLCWWAGAFLSELSGLGAPETQAAVVRAWRALETPARIVLNKLLTGTFRARVSRSVVEQAVAELCGLPRAIISRRLSDDRPPTAESYRGLTALPDAAIDEAAALPYPFHSIAPECDLDRVPGDAGEWQAQWFPNGGLRAQLVKRKERATLWTSDHGDVTDAYPALADCCKNLPDDTVIEGFFMDTRRDLAHTAGFVASDLLESEGRDLRQEPLGDRRAILEKLVDGTGAGGFLELSRNFTLSRWQDADCLIDECRSASAEAVILKRLDSAYGASAEPWRKLQPRPHEILAVLMYAESARGQAPSRFTNYTFGVWAVPGGERVLIPVAKTGDGLTDAERRQVDRFVLQHTRERHGPVRVVEPSLSVRLWFDAVEESPRHKAGLTLRAARAVALLPELEAARADTLDAVRLLVRPCIANAEPLDTAGRDRVKH